MCMINRGDRVSPWVPTKLHFFCPSISVLKPAIRTCLVNRPQKWPFEELIRQKNEKPRDHFLVDSSAPFYVQARLQKQQVQQDAQCRMFLVCEILVNIMFATADVQVLMFFLEGCRFHGFTTIFSSHKDFLLGELHVMKASRRLGLSSFGSRSIWTVWGVWAHHGSSVRRGKSKAFEAPKWCFLELCLRSLPMRHESIFG